MSIKISLQRSSIGKEELASVKEVFDSRWLGLGSKVLEFEKGLKDFLNTKKYVIAVNTGTSALHLSLDALGITKGDEVITPSLTFVATTQTIIATGATPVFCDIRDSTLNIDPQEIVKKITLKTKAIIVVHYRGMACEMGEILKIAKNHSLRVVEDAAHAFGSKYQNRKIGSFGDITCFSFDPIKNITCGEGGAILTSSSRLYKKLCIKRMLGIDKDAWSRYKNKRSWQYDVKETGFRYHMSNINAAIGVCQLKKADLLINNKVKIAKMYDQSLSKIKGLEIINTDYSQTALFMYLIRIKKNRGKFIKFLHSHDIPTGIHYLPSHQFSLFHNKFVQLPITDQVAKEIVTIPLHSELTLTEAKKVINTIKLYFKA